MDEEGDDHDTAGHMAQQGINSVLRGSCAVAADSRSLRSELAVLHRIFDAEEKDIVTSKVEKQVVILVRRRGCMGNEIQGSDTKRQDRAMADFNWSDIETSTLAK